MTSTILSTSKLGATLQGTDCHFRVWAPHATEVVVLIQEGDVWNSDECIRREPLSNSSNGYWTTTVHDVTARSLYRYEIHGPTGIKQKLDPAARDVVHSGLTRHDPDNHNASIVVTDEPFDWVKFKTPSFENFNIYQFHVGSFSGRNDHADKSIATFRDAITKFGYIRELGFNAIQPLPIQEFAMDRSWGYNPASFFAPESAYGHPKDLKHFVNEAHQHGLAVVFDVVYNHAGPDDNVLWKFDGYEHEGGIYFEGGQHTPWGRGPAWWKQEVQEFFYQNAKMYFEDYHADGLRFDVTTVINGNNLRDVTWRLQQEFPEKYMIAEHLPAHPWITTQGNFDATWQAKTHHQCQRALSGNDSVNRVLSFLGWDGFENAWNLVKYTMGSHDDVGDDRNGDAHHGLTNWDQRHRYFVDQFGGRENWHARAKCRLAWALNAAMPGTPMMFMGAECHMGAPNVTWGYWHDGFDLRGDHRFDWSIAGDQIGSEMRQLVKAANQVRWDNSALRSNTLSITHVDRDNGVIAFKRWTDGNIVLTIVNLSETNFENHSYGVRTGNQFGKWYQTLCTQDPAFGGWDGAGNAFYEPITQSDGRIYVNLPKWSVVVMKVA